VPKLFAPTEMLHKQTCQLPGSSELGSNRPSFMVYNSGVISLLAIQSRYLQNFLRFLSTSSDQLHAYCAVGLRPAVALPSLMRFLCDSIGASP